MEINTTPTPPEAWLFVYSVTNGRRVVGGIADSPQDPELVTALKRFQDVPIQRTLEIIRDDPSLDVNYSGIWIHNPACLTARDNWFKRYAHILDGYLQNPRRTQVFTFAEGKLTDPLQSHKSTANGPFPWPRRVSWPVCSPCGKRLAFVGVLDFRQFSEFKLPGESLVLHACQRCYETYLATWISRKAGVSTRGKRGSGEVSVGTRWETTDFPTPFTYADEVTDSGPFLAETGVFTSFCCFADKIGGHIFWIQGDCTPIDSTGTAMTFIGQFAGSPDVELGDSGFAYVFFSVETGETKIVMQSF
jgi:hypothetical protein